MVTNTSDSRFRSAGLENAVELSSVVGPTRTCEQMQPARGLEGPEFEDLRADSCDLLPAVAGRMWCAFGDPRTKRSYAHEIARNVEENG
jgi:hypothetical protein